MHTRFCVCELTPVHLAETRLLALCSCPHFNSCDYHCVSIPQSSFSAVLVASNFNHCDVQPEVTVVSVQYLHHNTGTDVTHIEMHRRKQDLQIIPHNNTVSFTPPTVLCLLTQTHFSTMSQCPSDSITVTCSPPLGPAM